MLKLAGEGGTTEIVATPHANYEYRYDGDVVAERIRLLAEATGGHPAIHRGCDFHLSFENIQDAVANPARYVIADGPYLLVEFPNGRVQGYGGALQSLLGRGLIPIMTHPERHPDLQKINAEFLHWIEMGCFAQITGQSLLGRFGRSAEGAAWEMIERRVAHFVASDAHGVNDRTPRLDEAFQAVSQRAGADVAELLFVSNPRAVVAGQSVERPAPKRRGWRKLFQ